MKLHISLIGLVLYSLTLLGACQRPQPHAAGPVASQPAVAPQQSPPSAVVNPPQAPPRPAAPTMQVLRPGETPKFAAGPKSELDELSDVAMNALAQFPAVRAGLRRVCVSLVDFKIDGDHAEGDLREKHGGGCAGDPGVAPKIGALRVMRKDRSVLAYDVINDAYVPIEKYQGP